MLHVDVHIFKYYINIIVIYHIELKYLNLFSMCYVL